MKSLLLLPLVFLSVSVFADVAKDVSIDNSFARAAIKEQRNSAAFMQVTNQGNAVAIVYAKSSVAGIVELHTHLNDKGVMRMRKIEKINLPTNETITLQPGGLHIMLLGLNRDLKVGESVDVILGFSDGSEKQLQIPVQNMMMGSMKGMKKHDMNHDKPKLMTH